MTALLNKRQQIARAIAQELNNKFSDCWVLNALPLDDGQRLRIQIMPPVNEVVQFLRDVGHQPIFVSMLPRVMLNGSMPMTEIYEVDLPQERTCVPNDLIQGERSTGKKEVDAEMEGFRKYFGFDKVRK